MKKKKNTIPFVLLLMIHTALLVFTFHKNKQRKKLFVLLMSNIGVAYLFEYIVLNIFNAYTYKPKIMKKPFFDDIVGAILSQAIFVPFTAVFLTSVKIGWIGKFIGGLYFSIVELIFVRLKIFKKHWWKTIYTLILIPVYFKFSDLWNWGLNQKFRGLRVMSLFLMMMVTEANVLFLFAATRKFRFGIGKFHSWKEHFVIVPLYAIATSLMSTIILLRENTWRKKFTALLSSIVLNTFFKKIKLLRSKIHWLEFILIRIILITVYGIFRDFVFENEKEETE
ncbi:hypothetical protein [Bacillus sp. MRMR6]|uniref:hypothetical protein n=1 Tax=Bacillus sp. MRMR6 TaxID=1928617 RepID=UPI0009531AB7|nr:hypothetical protein [Bacillus sp. MRMR6]OLS39907.1 hypothetical protein BTR25_11870 [Bacillus sp. MRMR6]